MKNVFRSLVIVLILFAFIGCNDQGGATKKANAVKSLEVSLVPATRGEGTNTFYVGDTFGKDNLTVIATLNDETSSEVTDYTMSVSDGGSLTTSGTQTVTVTYKGVSESIEFPVNSNLTFQVKVPTVALTRSISYTTFTFSFNDRQDKDSNGFLTISDSSSSNTYPFHWGTDGITYTDSEPSYKVEVDTKQFTNTRGTGDLEFLQALEVTIEGTPVACKSSKTCTGISCNSDSIKTEFYKNEIHYIDENLEVYKLYSDGTKETLNPLLYTITQEGNTVTINYCGKTTSFEFTDIEVEPTVTAVTISKNPDMYYYLEGETLNIKGLEIDVTYDNDYVATVDTGFTTSISLDKELDGTETEVFVTYGGIDSDNSFPISFDKSVYTLKTGALLSLYELEGIGIKTVEFVKGTSIPKRIKETKDNSADQKNQVIAYLDDEDTKLVITGKLITLNENSSLLFSGLVALSEIKGLANVDASNVTNMSGMFAACTNLTSLDLSALDTSKVTNMMGMFAACHNLSSITFPEDTSKVTNMSLMFAGIDSLTEIDTVDEILSFINVDLENCKDISLDLSGLDTSAVTNMCGMFAGREHITKITLGDSFKTDNVTDMSFMFALCKGITTVDFTNLVTSNVKNMIGMFAGCTGLKSFADVKGLDISGAKSLSLMFTGCTGLETVEFKNLNTSNDSIFAGMFAGCTNLKSVSFVYDEQTAFKAANLVGMFALCGNEMKLEFKKVEITDETNINTMLIGCTGLEKVSFVDSVATTKDLSKMFLGCTSLKSIDLTGLDTSGVTDMSFMFACCPCLTNISFSGEGSKFTTKDVTNMSFMFAGLNIVDNSINKILESITDVLKLDVLGIDKMDIVTTLNLTGLDTSKVTDMRGMFAGRSNLVNITFDSSFDTSSVTDMSYMFLGCSGFKKLDLSGLTTTSLKNMSFMFAFCPQLASVDLPDTSSVENMSFMFAGIDSLDDITTLISTISSLTTRGIGTDDKIAINLENLKTDSVTNMSGMFACRSNVKSVSFGEYFTVNTGELFVGMFAGCSGLESVNFNFKQLTPFKNAGLMFIGCGSSLSINFTNLEIVDETKQMFAGCTGLKSITFKESKASTSSLMGLFAGCASLETADLRGLDTSLVENMSFMFAGCPQLTNILTTGDSATFTTENVTNMRGMFAGINSLDDDLSSVLSLLNFDPEDAKIDNSVKTIDLSIFDTSKVTNMSMLFAGRSNLTSLDLSGVDTKNVENMSLMFTGCENLASIKFTADDSTKQKFTTSAVTLMTGMFTNCKKLASIDLSKFNTSKVTDMSLMFTGCEALESVNLKDLDFTSAISLTGMFAGSGIKSVVLDNFTTGANTILLGMFYNCTNLESVEFKNTTINKLYGMFTTPASEDDSLNNLSIKFTNCTAGTDLSALFTGCSTLKSIDLSGLDTSATTSMVGMFAECTNLESIKFAGTTDAEKKFTTAAVKLMTGMFTDCKKLASIDLDKFNTSNVTDMSLMFTGCEALTDIDLTKFDFTNVKSLTGMFAGTGLTEIIFDNLKTGENTSFVGMFYNCTELASVHFKNTTINKLYGMFATPASEDDSMNNLSIKFTNCTAGSNLGAIFTGCSTLKSIDLSGLDTSATTSMAGMFTGCTALESIDLSGVDTSSVTDMSLMFTGCTNLAKIKFAGTTDAEKKFTTKNVTTMAGMFTNCKALESIDLSTFNTENVTDMTGMFAYCTKLTTMIFDGLDFSKVTNFYALFTNSGLEKLTFKKCTAGTTLQAMFSVCTTLKEVDLSGLDTSNVTDMSLMFTGCTNLAKIKFAGTTDAEKKFTTKNVTTMAGMFTNCKALESIDLSTFNTENVTDMTGMFAYCTALKTMVFENLDFSNVTSFAAIFTNSGLEKLTFKNCTAGTTLQAMFSICTTLKEVDLSGLDTSNVTNMSLMFTGCESLNKVTFATEAEKKFTTAKVTTMAGMFTNCKALESIDLSTFKTSLVTDMTGMFTNCKKLTSVDLKGLSFTSVTSLKGMFAGSGLTSVILTGLTSPANKTAFLGMFYNCTNLANVYFKDSTINKLYGMFATSEDADEKLNGLSVTFTNCTAGSDLSSLFALCSTLQSADMRGLNTSSTTNMSLMFSGCSSLTTIKFTADDVNNQKFKTDSVTTMTGMFTGCSSLRTLDLSTFKTSKVKSMVEMFAYCSNLKTIYVTKDWWTVSNLVVPGGGTGMFSGCTSLVGQNNSKFASGCTDKTYAQIGNGMRETSTWDWNTWSYVTQSTPTGYLTNISQKPKN